MKFLVLVFVQLLIVHIAWSATFVGGNYTNPDHAGKCYNREDDDPPTILSPGETGTIKGKCVQARCHSDLSMTFASCGVVTGPKEHYIPANHSLPYPECCPTHGLV